MADYYDPDDLPKFATEIARERPDLAKRFFEWYSATLAEGEGDRLTKREKALIGLAVAHALPCPYCIDSFAQTCLEAGADTGEMVEAIHVAASVSGGATLIHGLQALRSVDGVSM